MTPDDGDRPVLFREFEAALADIRRAVEVALKTNTPSVPIKEFFEAVLLEKERAMSVAEQEREKSARALREELGRAIADGDRHLRNHVDTQVDQMSAAQKAASELVVMAIDGLRRETHLTHSSSEQAIAKAETATNGRMAADREVTDARFAELNRALKDMAEKVSQIG